MKLIFEKSVEGRKCSNLPKNQVPASVLPSKHMRQKPARLAEVSELDLTRHYSELSRRTFGMNTGFYPLGSCTMKYNPKINDEIAGYPGFANIHPLQDIRESQGCLEILYKSEKLLAEITGMDSMTFQPAAGAHGELCGILMIKAYHASRNDTKRTKIIVPDSAHGTNPATASMCGYDIINIESKKDGRVDTGALRAVLGDDVAGIMLTNPNTLGLFEDDILEITQAVRDSGGLCYYDGANLNAVMGVVRPGDMGFDVVHLNLHKTFSTPHGGGGPGSGAVGCKAILADFLPDFHVVKKGDKFEFSTPDKSIGSVKAFYGNFLVTLKALCYVLSLGADDVARSAKIAVLNANYMRKRLSEKFEVASEGICMHEFVMTLSNLKKETGISVLDVAKAFADKNMHPPTMYFPLIVSEALMIEPPETESKEMLDKAILALFEIYDRAYTDPESLKKAPVNTPIRRVDEVQAARNPVLRYIFE